MPLSVTYSGGSCGHAFASVSGLAGTRYSLPLRSVGRSDTGAPMGILRRPCPPGRRGLLVAAAPVVAGGPSLSTPSSDSSSWPTESSPRSARLPGCGSSCISAEADAFLPDAAADAAAPLPAVLRRFDDDILDGVGLTRRAARRRADSRRQCALRSVRNWHCSSLIGICNCMQALVYLACGHCIAS